MGKKAWLITNEYLNTNKYSEINLCLVEAARRQGVELTIQTNSELLVHLHERISYHKEESETDFILFWDKDIRLAKHLEFLGYRVFNSAKAIEACDDKSLTHLILQHHGIKMPETIVAPMTYPAIGYRNYKFLSMAADMLGFPIVIKECFGSFGQQVYLAENISELKNKVQEIGAKPMIFQKYIAESCSRDIRIQVVGEEAAATMYRYSDNGDFRANLSNGGKMRRYEATKEQKELALKCCKLLDLDFGGVDILFGKNEEPIVCEVNSNAHFKNIHDCTGVPVADMIIKHCLDK